MIPALNGEALRRALCGGFHHLRANYRLLDDLNVFPVPDGDTGVNMVFTLEEGIRRAEALHDPTCAEIAQVLFEHVAGNSRGNSGFILSRFMCGLAETLTGREVVDAAAVALGFQRGAYLARTALFEPVEGTMLTVLSAVEEALCRTTENDPLSALVRARDVAMVTVMATPGLLAPLARAGVVDAGALGLQILLDGMVRALEGQASEPVDPSPFRFAPTEPGAAPARPRFRYCTEVHVEVPPSRPTRELRTLLGQVGDSVALVDDGTRIRLHVHTNEPERILDLCRSLGTILLSKVDDMEGQIRANSPRNRSTEAPRIIAVVPGAGFHTVMEGFGVSTFVDHDAVLPSVQEILDVVEAQDDGPILLLPNHRNIIPAALQVQAQAGARHPVTVLPTRNIVQGIAALYAYSENEDAETNLAGMASSMQAVRCLEVYRATRDSRWGNGTIREGQHFVIADGDVLAVQDDLIGTLVTALGRMDLPRVTLLTLYQGRRLDPALLLELEAVLSRAWPDVAVETHFGGQARAELVVSAE